MVCTIKHFNSKEKVELPQVIIYSKEDLNNIELLQYKNEYMLSTEM